MNNPTKKAVAAITGVAIFATAAFFTSMPGCGQRPPPPTDIVAVESPDCPPDAKFCPVTIEELPDEPGEKAKVLGKLQEPVRARVLVVDAKRSDPRVIDMDVPAGVLLVDDREGGR